ncbi:hypothetical protein HanXRQr2_Chr06g0241841 [Helianthus annuus]|uniref:Uncharacterized protein n=1 Tax=Helianthus annuus TaxID=4232 RepID=A0A9K3IPZ2_HELAN|nr:hypothetical protein HanXRQr2_Chr06g0241841 [Helianthus annuus]
MFMQKNGGKTRAGSRSSLSSHNSGGGGGVLIQSLYTHTHTHIYISFKCVLPCNEVVFQ